MVSPTLTQRGGASHPAEVTPVRFHKPEAQWTARVPSHCKRARRFRKGVSCAENPSPWVPRPRASRWLGFLCRRACTLSAGCSPRAWGPRRVPIRDRRSRPYVPARRLRREGRWGALPACFTVMGGVLSAGLGPASRADQRSAFQAVRASTPIAERGPVGGPAGVLHGDGRGALRGPGARVACRSEIGAPGRLRQHAGGALVPGIPANLVAARESGGKCERGALLQPKRHPTTVRSGCPLPDGSGLRAGSGARTRTSRWGQKILSLPRLPISPSRQAGPAANFRRRKTRIHTPNAPPARHIRSG